MNMLDGANATARAKAEEKTQEKIDEAVALKIDPFWNIMSLVFAAIFAYFLMTEDNQCYSDPTKGGAWGKYYEGAVDVTAQFNMIGAAGFTLLILSAFAIHYETRIVAVKPFALLARILFLVWFSLLLYFRFRNTGQACSGDGLQSEPRVSGLYLIGWGYWLKLYGIMQTVLWILCRILQLIVSNRVRTEIEEGGAKMGGLF